MADWWCPNCQQRVRPQIGAPAHSYAIPLTMLGWTVVHYWSSPDYLIALVIAGGLAILVGAVEVAIWPERACPLCKTRQLERQAPPTPPRSSRGRRTARPPR